jgi:hypothetical protein
MVARHWNTICFIGRGNSFDSPEFVFEYWRDESDFFTTPWPPARSHCDTYYYASLQVQEIGGGRGWRVTDGSTDLQHFATESDAINGMAVIEGMDEVCRISTETPDSQRADITYNMHL